ncbi:hypothetical protein MRB53_001124 [Persea americana]|uniref:Uncharacterized protein n=1 Tax=Persea americana TaxID=3435 RepID=A0ACC2MQU3_PERAE|nr:hypothetical protein MRB53_001124 [Persea americana]
MSFNCNGWRVVERKNVRDNNRENKARFSHSLLSLIPILAERKRARLDFVFRREDNNRGSRILILDCRNRKEDRRGPGSEEIPGGRLNPLLQTVPGKENSHGQSVVASSPIGDRRGFMGASSQQDGKKEEDFGPVQVQSSSGQVQPDSSAAEELSSTAVLQYSRRL